MKKILIIPHLEKKEVKKKLNELLIWAKRTSLEVRLLKEDAKVIGLKEYGFLKRDACHVDFALVLGGDGTILRAVRETQGKSLPILGINFGKIGFLSEVEAKHMKKSIKRVINGDFEIEERLMLQSEIVFTKDKKTFLAFNEIVIGRGANSKLIELNVKINKQHFYKYSCDGLIFATPTGSTAYSLSAGGPIISSLADVYLLNPICPHSMFNRSLVLKREDEIEVEPANYKGSEIIIQSDGKVIFCKKRLEKVKIRVSKNKVELIKLGEKGFQLIKRKLRNWEKNI